MQKFLFCGLLYFICAQSYFLLTEATTPEVCPEIVSRASWGASAPLEADYIVIPVKNVIIHHTETPECTSKSQCSTRVKNIQRYHMENLEFHDIGYKCVKIKPQFVLCIINNYDFSFLVGGDGRVYEGAGWHKVGAHARGYNDKSLGLAFIGDFKSELPFRKQLQAAKDLLQCGVELGELDRQYKLFGALQVRPTDSPGMKLYREIKKWVHFTDSPPH
ncbi:Amidase 2 domain containing protein [Asbolus verrucosus]|uniref:Peptidoglycan-recognition protein n=1 Tax=Asbolus verrucosus TaxID=1661398 RepID=A0A482WAW4_ASBVE|nr:Amidase 2 domain containing protein [Asbolus verrucosus]